MAKTNQVDEDIEDLFYPEHNQLIITDEDVTATIIDAEIDPIECKFNNDYCIELNTEELTYITLTVSNLERMIELIYEAQDHFKEQAK